MAEQQRMLGNRVKKRFRHLKKGFEREQIGAFRLYDWDIPEIRAVVDWYEGHLVIAEYARKQTEDFPQWLEAMGRGVGEALEVPPSKVFLKRRQTRSEGNKRYTKLGRRGRRIEVRERDLRFWVNLSDFIDTGLFPDHRDTRKMIRGEVKGRRVLNLFCYTGAFSCAAAAGGAQEVTSVDRNETWLGWVKENLKLNELWGHRHHTRHRLEKSDFERFLRRAAKEGQRYDLAIVDPPSFSRSRDRGAEDRVVDSATFEVLRDHPALLEAVLQVMSPGGVIYFSTNHQRFEPKLDGLALQACEEITEQTMPPDYRNRQAHRGWRLVAPG